jgi:hypothetical protein
MRKVWVIVFAIGFNVLAAQARDALIIGQDLFILHPDRAFQYNGKTVWLDDIYPEDPGHDGSMVVDLSGLSPNPFIIRRSIGLNDGFAAMRAGERYIVYDPSVFGYGSSGPSRWLVLGHEIGHHVCGHTVGMMQSDPWAKELEADRYSGAAIRRLGYLSIQDELESARRTYSTEGSASHPPQAMRIEAIWNGYNNGSPCERNSFVKPYEPTEEDQARTAKTVDDFCQEMAREFCTVTDLNEKRERHRLIGLNCPIRPISNPITYCNPPCKVGFIAFPGVDCVGGGRYRAEGISTSIRLP